MSDPELQSLVVYAWRNRWVGFSSGVCMVWCARDGAGMTRPLTCRFLLDLGRDEGPRLRMPRLERSIGAVYRPDTKRLRTRPAPSSCSDLPTSQAPVNPMAATNKCLAQRNKTCTAKANKRQEKPYRQRHFGRLAKLAKAHLWLSLGRDTQLH